jgi:hypothetical protein
MPDVETVLPTDAFSRRLRELIDNPGAARASSTINRIDFYGRNETWVLDTFRIEANEEVFLQRITADSSIRMVLPPEVTAAMNRARDRAAGQTRRRGAQQAVATKRAKGIPVGNPAALAAARLSKPSGKTRRKPGRRKR